MSRWVIIFTSVILAGTQAVFASNAGKVFPRSKGSTWHYRYSTGGSYTLTVISSSQKHITEKQTGTVHATIRYKRTTDGWVSGDGGHPHSIEVQPQKVTVSITHSSGVLIPKSSLWKPGYKWLSSTTNTRHVSMHRVMILVKSTITRISKITGMKQISVPAGKFNCYRVRTIEHITTRVTVGNISRVKHAKTKVIDYYARGVGLVERDADHNRIDLIRYHIQ
ncbi:MAG: hypothetical protein ACP5O1_00115 [Phycisphaerae bacterium]